MTKLLDRMTFDEVEAYLKDGPGVVIIPVGATEQHGVHGALGTDTYAALAVSESVAEKANALVAPAVPFGLSLTHRHFPGYAGLSAETLLRVLTELTDSFLRQGFGTVFMISGHRGNDPVMTLAASAARAKVRDSGMKDVDVLHMSYQDANRGRLKEITEGFRPMRDVDVRYGSDGHGGAVECSIAMTIAPDGYRLNKLQKPDSSRADRRRGLPFKVDLDIEEVTDGGIFGDPTGTSEEFGKHLVEVTAQRIAEQLEAYLQKRLS